MKVTLTVLAVDKVSTDSASRGLSAIAELLVLAYSRTDTRKHQRHTCISGHYLNVRYIIWYVYGSDRYLY